MPYQRAMAQIYRFALFAPLVFAAALVVGLTVHPEHSLVSDPLAALLLPGRPGSSLVNLAVALTGLLHVALGIALLRDPEGPGRMAARLIIGIGLLCMICALGFPMDAPGGQATAVGAGHIALVGLSALITLTAAVRCALRARTAIERVASGWSAAIMVTGGVFAGLSTTFGLSLAGLGEVVTQSTVQLWLGGLALAAFQRTRTGKLA